MRDAVLMCARLQGEKSERAAARVLAVVDRLQRAKFGSAALDSLIDETFGTLATDLDSRMIAHLPTRRGARWSEELGASIGLLTADYNFSVGQRDGICWAWIQPNDNWQPQEFEARHDHPAGSGLIVAYTAPLAMTTATIILCMRVFLRGQ
jgi:hypothetical protein